MNRNPLAPFFLIMAAGLILMLVLAVNGVNNAKEIAAEKKGGGAKQEAPAKPEDIYKQSCIGCHGDQYQGGVGPALKGVGDHLSKDEIKAVITNGRGAMPSGLVPADKADEMAEWLGTLK
jgi:cytochrome c550